MKLLFSLVAVFCLANSAHAQTDLVRVAVTTAKDASGFVDESQKNRNQAVKDVLDRMKGKKKTISIVSDESAADLVVEIKSVEIVDGAVQTRVNPLGGGLISSGKKFYRMIATLRLGDYTTDLTAEKLFTYAAAWDIADDTEKWVKDNHQQVIAKRAK